MAQRITIASLCLWLALVGTAEATSYVGKTSQGRRATVVTGTDGLVTRIRIGYSAPCRSGKDYRFPNIFRLEPPFKTSTADDVTDTVVVRDRLKGGGRTRQTVTVTAHRTIDAAGVETWSGTFKTRVVLTRSGKRLDVCELERVSWSASSA
ncbi:hypothetical protein OJ997_14230 [Solirubrobacter phytolaccae]|uniref:Uncharacterized protein n=1 Tax=Solirubrobacter phytolaccae TaxID=1404360 RepID=A0A9X3S8G8_9ACTN|nr:hypothetical protein [Solirubrobacter phytolaccae]MDA0181458.1 hypothetical protein [Solirubrobacter phytolaccae]